MELVSIATAAGYELPSLRVAIIKLLEPLGGMGAFVNSGEKILLKPNMLAAKEPDLAVTTHPAVVQVVAELVREAGGIAFIGDSPGFGGFLRVAEKSGIYNAAVASGATLVEFDQPVELQGSGLFRKVSLAFAYYEADKIINIPKLKTHEMMTMTCAVKNLFGAVVGAEKVGWHLKAGNSREQFAKLLLEIYQLKKPVLNIVDAVVAMEGNGPGSGDPIKCGMLIAGSNAVAVDVIAARLAGIDSTLLPVELEAVKMQLFGSLINDIKLCGVQIDKMSAINFRLPAGMDLHFGMPVMITKMLKKQLISYPAANKKNCILCGVCRDACPPAAITIKNSVLSVDKARCIRCWCCRELCPLSAMEIKSSLLLKTLKKLSRNKGCNQDSSSSEPSGISR